MTGASGGEMPTTLISPGFSLLRGIRFTLQFRETITIAARAKDRAPKGTAMQHAPAVAVTAEIAAMARHGSSIRSPGDGRRGRSGQKGVGKNRVPGRALR